MDSDLLNFTPGEWNFKLGKALDLNRREKEYLVEYSTAKNSLPYVGKSLVKKF